MQLTFTYKQCIVSLLLLFLPAISFAAAHSVNPRVIDRQLQKRDIINETITVKNISNHLIRLYPTVNEISIDDGGIQTFVEPSMTDRTTSITSWLQIGRGRIQLQPGESREIPLTIKVNPDVAPGEYHALVAFPEGSNRPSAEKQVRMGNAPGTVVRIEVGKEQTQFLRLEKFTVEHFIKSDTEGSIEYVLSNPGNAEVIPKGEIIFYTTRGIEVAAIPINADAKAVKKGEHVSFSEHVPDDLRMGKYKAFLSVEYGDSQTASIHDTTFFYVLPIMHIILIFIAVLLFVVLLALFVHRRYDASVEDDGTSDVALFIRQGRSEDKEHDIDLSKKNHD